MELRVKRKHDGKLCRVKSEFCRWVANAFRMKKWPESAWVGAWGTVRDLMLAGF